MTRSAAVPRTLARGATLGHVRTILSFPIFARYTADSKRLGAELQGYIDAASAAHASPAAPVRGIIAPHAGYRFSGPTAAHSYSCVDPNAYDRVLILGPSHTVRLRGCALTSATAFETPCGDLQVDLEGIDALRATGLFAERIPIDDEEEEWSLELQCPFLAHIFRARLEKIRVLPIIVGALSAKDEGRYGALFAPFLEPSARVLVVVSSDFCHWGARFSYQYLPGLPYADKSVGDLVEDLDRSG